MFQNYMKQKQSANKSPSNDSILLNILSINDDETLFYFFNSSHIKKMKVSNLIFFKLSFYQNYQIVDFLLQKLNQPIERINFYTFQNNSNQFKHNIINPFSSCSDNISNLSNEFGLETYAKKTIENL